MTVEKRLPMKMTIAYLYLFFLTLASAQPYDISTVAGNGKYEFDGAGQRALSARLVSARYVAADAAGNVFVSDSYFHQVFQITVGGTITVAAGNGQGGFSGDGGPATDAQLDNPAGLAVDASGNLYIADNGNARIRKVSPHGAISTVAGNGRTGIAGDGGSATSAAVGGPIGLALDTAGNLYITQTSANVVRKVSADGAIATFAGNGRAGFSGDGGQAAAAMFFAPAGMRLDAAGNLFVADSQNNRIRKITPQGIVTTVAGNGSAIFAGDGNAATAASLALPADVAIDSSNNLYISDASNGRLRVVNAAGAILTVAGGGASLLDGSATEAALAGIAGIALDNRGGIVIAVTASRRVRRVAGQTITSIAGVLPSAGIGDNVAATSTPLLGPYGVAIDSDGNLYVSDQTDHRVRKISPAGIVITAAGTGIFGSTGNGGPATNAQVGAPRGLSLDSNGNLYIVSGSGATVRRVASDGTATTVAGGLGAGFSGDGLAATAARFLSPTSVVADASGNLYIADSSNNRIRRVGATSSIVTTIAGTGVAGFSGDEGPAIAAQLFLPRQLAVDSSGSLYIADTGNGRVRKITPDGVITTVAGRGGNTFSGDNGPATLAQIAANGVAVDATGNLYISGATRIRRVDAATGVITTIAGTGTPGFSGDGALATDATLDSAGEIAVDGACNIYFTDQGNLRVRKLTPEQIAPETAGSIALR